MTPAYLSCSNLDDYLAAYGGALSQRAQSLFQPLHVPGVDPPIVMPGDFKRDAFPAQAEVISAAVKVLCRDRAIVLDAEAGCGKTLMAMQLVHKHAQYAPSKWARGPGRHQMRRLPDQVPVYRALVMAPDHLPPKWTRELQETLPEEDDDGPTPVITWIKDWKEVLALVDRRREMHEINWSERPLRPEWYIIGRDCAKLGAGWDPIGLPPSKDSPPPSVKRHRWTDKNKTNHKGVIAACPRCGGAVLDTNDIPVDTEKMSRRKYKCRCTAEHLTGEATDPPDWHESTCGEPLWNWVRRPRNRWAPCDIISRKLRGFFDYFVLDEMHEEKGEGTAQANAMGAIATSIPHYIGLTGTIMGGYAWHLYYMLMRIAPDVLVRQGFEWGQAKEFMQRYGKIETVYITKHSGNEQWSSNKQSKGKSQTKKAEYFRPGIMPGLVPEIMLPATLCLSLDEMSSNLPPFRDNPIAVNPDAEQAEAYENVYHTLKSALNDMLAKGDKRLLGAFNSTLLGWIDICHDDWGWVGVNGKDGWEPIVKPPRLKPEVIRPKEQELIRQIEWSMKRGYQTWVYAEQTDTRDVVPRLRWLLGHFGIHNFEVMPSSLDRKKREAWIKDLRDYPDVVISHPKLVETGFDLFNREYDRYTHNYNHLIFYQMRYNPFTTMQAGHRAYRIGQLRECLTTFLYYEGTAQATCMALMGKKFAAAAALKGNLTAEGISLLAGGEDSEMAMARALLDRIEIGGRNWARVGDGGEGCQLETDLPPRGKFRNFEPSTVPFPKDRIAVGHHLPATPAVTFDLNSFLKRLKG